MARVSSREVVMRPDAAETVKELAGPQVRVAASELALAIPSFVPVQSGTSQRLFRRALRSDKNEDGSSRVSGFPPHWHWFEYGTRWNPPYRPIENAARSLGLAWSARSGGV